MSLREYKHSVLRAAGTVALPAGVNLLCRSLEITRENGEELELMIRKGNPFVLAFWHGTMMVPWYAHRDKGFLGLTSKSGDGDQLARLLRGWNYHVVRGSSSKDGSIALEIMVDYLRHEGPVAITPDGPRGPRHEMKAGAVVAAKKAGVPLILCGAGFEKKKVLNNWDRFAIPKPFSKVKLIYSDPIQPAADLTREETSKVIGECEVLLNELQRKALEQV